MDRKICWIDLETSGLNPSEHGIVQLAGILEVNGIEKCTFDFKVRPFPQQKIDPEALAINGFTHEMLESHMEPHKVYQELIEIFSGYVNKYDKTDKMFFAGYNSQFDDTFLRKFFENCGDGFYGSWFARPTLDVYVIAMDKMGAVWNTLTNHKLATLADYFSIERDGTLHNALCDIKMTRELYYKVAEINNA